MRHFSVAEWIDFARLKGLRTFSAMQNHLDDGCIRCASSAATWKRMTEFAKHESDQQVPETAVRMVSANFWLLKSSLAAQKISWPKLVFDSLAAPVTAGVRGRVAPGRQLLYKSGTVCIDLQILPEPGSDSIVLTGQFLDSLRPQRGVSVSLVRNGSSISSKQTNELGEFDFGFEHPEEMHLAFGLATGYVLVVPVPGKPVPSHYGLNPN